MNAVCCSSETGSCGLQCDKPRLPEIHTVNAPAGNMTNASMQAFILRRLRPSAVFLRPFEKLTRKLLKAALQLFGTAEDRAVRVQAILFVRQVAIVLPQPALNMCLKVSRDWMPHPSAVCRGEHCKKQRFWRNQRTAWMHGSSSNHVVAQQGVVRTFSANAKFSSPSTAAHLSFMATCIVELFGLDEEAAYSHAFTVRPRPSCVCG